MSMLNELTQLSQKGYIDSMEYAEKVLDNLMKCNVHEFDRKWFKNSPDMTVSSMIEAICEEYYFEDADPDELLAYTCNLLDRIMERTSEATPWVRLFSTVTLDTLFGVYSKRTNTDIDYGAKLKQVIRLIEKNTLLMVTETTTVGEALFKVRRERQKPWSPDGYIRDYKRHIIDCHEIVKEILYDGPVDIYSLERRFDEESLDDYENELDSEIA